MFSSVVCERASFNVPDPSEALESVLTEADLQQLGLSAEQIQKMPPKKLLFLLLKLNSASAQEAALTFFASLSAAHALERTQRRSGLRDAFLERFRVLVSTGGLGPSRAGRAALCALAYHVGAPSGMEAAATALDAVLAAGADAATAPVVLGLLTQMCQADAITKRPWLSDTFFEKAMDYCQGQLAYGLGPAPPPQLAAAIVALVFARPCQRKCPAALGAALRELFALASGRLCACEPEARAAAAAVAAATTVAVDADGVRQYLRGLSGPECEAFLTVMSEALFSAHLPQKDSLGAAQFLLATCLARVVQAAPAEAARRAFSRVRIVHVFVRGLRAAKRYLRQILPLGAARNPARPTRRRRVSLEAPPSVVRLANSSAPFASRLFLRASLCGPPCKFVEIPRINAGTRALVRALLSYSTVCERLATLIEVFAPADSPMFRIRAFAAPRECDEEEHICKGFVALRKGAHIAKRAQIQNAAVRRVKFEGRPLAHALKLRATRAALSVALSVPYVFRERRSGGGGFLLGDGSSSIARPTLQALLLGVAPAITASAREPEPALRLATAVFSFLCRAPPKARASAQGIGAPFDRKTPKLELMALLLATRVLDLSGHTPLLLEAKRQAVLFCAKAAYELRDNVEELTQRRSVLLSCFSHKLRGLERERFLLAVALAGFSREIALNFLHAVVQNRLEKTLEDARALFFRNLDGLVRAAPELIECRVHARSGVAPPWRLPVQQKPLWGLIAHACLNVLRDENEPLPDLLLGLLVPARAQRGCGCALRQVPHTFLAHFPATLQTKLASGNRFAFDVFIAVVTREFAKIRAVPVAPMEVVARALDIAGPARVRDMDPRQTARLVRFLLAAPHEATSDVLNTTARAHALVCVSNGLKMDQLMETPILAARPCVRGHRASRPARKHLLAFVCAASGRFRGDPSQDALLMEVSYLARRMTAWRFITKFAQAELDTLVRSLLAVARRADLLSERGARGWELNILSALFRALVFSPANLKRATRAGLALDLFSRVGSAKDLHEQAYVPRHAGVRVLTLDGGGAKGIVELLTLDLIEQLTGLKTYQMFDLIIGTSVGSLIGGALSRGMTALQGRTIYPFICNTVFRRLPGAHFSFLGAKRPHIYGENPLIMYLKFFFGHRQMAASAGTLPAFVAVATDAYVKSSPYFFHTHPLRNRSELRFSGKFGTSDSIPYWMACRASAAAPMFFNVFELADGTQLADGGLGFNNPAAASFSIAAAMFPNHKIDLLVSLGCGSAKTRSGTTFFDWIRGIVMSLTTTRPTSIIAEALSASQGAEYFRVDPPTSAASDVQLDTADLARLARLEEHIQQTFDDSRFERLFQNLARAIYATLFYVAPAAPRRAAYARDFTFSCGALCEFAVQSRARVPGPAPFPAHVCTGVSSDPIGPITDLEVEEMRFQQRGLEDCRAGDEARAHAEISADEFRLQVLSGTANVTARRGDPQRFEDSRVLCYSVEEVEPPEHLLAAQSRTQGAFRRFQVRFVCDTAGEFRVGLTLSDRHISGSPFTFILGAAEVTASLCQVSAPSLRLQKGSIVTLQVDLRDRFRNKVRLESARLAVGVADNDNNTIPTELLIGPRGPLIKFIPKHAGAHICSVRVDGAHVSNSPFVVEIN